MAMMPLSFIVASMRCAAEDMVGAVQHYDWLSFNVALRQMRALIDELEQRDEARERIAANDVTAGEVT